MKLKYSLRIEGQDYTDKLISVSSIDTGVRTLGFGYISDITVECAYDSNVMDAVGQTAEVGLLAEGASLVYKGSVEKIVVQGGEVTLSLRMKSPREYFKTRQRYYASVYNKYVAVPVVYGNGTCKARLLAVQKKTDGFYALLVGDNPNISGGYELSPGAYGIDSRVFKRFDAPRWAKLPDGTPNVWDISVYTKEEYLRIYRTCHEKRGVNENESGNLVEAVIGTTPEVFVEGGIYKWIRFVWNGGSICADSWQAINVYEWRDLSPNTEIFFETTISVSSIPYPPDIIADILSRNGINYRRETNFIPILLTFQADESFYEITQKVAEQGLIYVIPTADKFRIVPAVYPYLLSPKFTFTENHILTKSIQVEKEPPQVRQLTVIYNREGDSLTRGSGQPHRQYKADYITDATSAEKFADAYLEYHQKTTRVKFSTPLLPELLLLEVGDIVALDYSLYSINQSFRIVQKTIRKDKISWVLKEA